MFNSILPKKYFTTAKHNSFHSIFHQRKYFEVLKGLKIIFGPKNEVKSVLRFSLNWEKKIVWGMIKNDKL